MFEDQDYFFGNNNNFFYQEQLDQRQYDSQDSVQFQDLYSFKQISSKPSTNPSNDSSTANLSIQVKEEYYQSSQNLENEETSILDFQAKLTPSEYQQLSTMVILSQRIQDKIKHYQQTYNVTYKPLNIPKTMDPIDDMSPEALIQIKSQRRIKVQRYLIKKQKRLQNKNKRSYYSIRTQMAQNRLRVKGRFVKNIHNE